MDSATLTIIVGVAMFTVIVLALVAVILIARKQMVSSGSVSLVVNGCLLYTSPSPRDQRGSRMPSSA